MTSKTTIDLHQTITDSILAELEKGITPWAPSWDIGTAHQWPINFSTGNRYHGINTLLFWMQARKSGYSSHAWLTFKQAKALGGHVRKHEKGTRGLFYKMLDKKDAQTGEMITLPMAKAFHAYNLDQIDGLDDAETLDVPIVTQDDYPEADAFIRDIDITIEYGNVQPSYSPSADIVRCPERCKFSSAGNFYATLNHELIHATGHSSRCDRDLTGQFNDSSYVREEMTAEIGSSFLCAEWGIRGTLQEHASYIDHWIKLLKADKTAITKAAKLASAAHAYLIDNWQANITTNHPTPLLATA